jgi:hypothetical protein
MICPVCSRPAPARVSDALTAIEASDLAFCLILLAALLLTSAVGIAVM